MAQDLGGDLASGLQGRRDRALQRIPCLRGCSEGR
jgi:hypothetical protein